MQVKDSPEAMAELSKWQSRLTQQAQARLLQAELSKDGDEWCVLSGPDLAFDRAGFGPSIAEAVYDYLRGYLGAS